MTDRTGRGDPTVAVVGDGTGTAADAVLAVERSVEEVTVVVEGSVADALDGHAAVDCLVVTDDLDGAVPAVERARERSDAPVVVAAADGDETLAGDAVAAGADEYVPLDPDSSDPDGATGRLVDRVRSCLDRRDRTTPESLVHSLPGGAAVVRDGVVEHANPQFEALVGDVAGSPVGVRLADLLPAEDRDAVAGLLAAAGDGAGAKPRSAVVGEGLATPDVELRAAPMDPGSGSGSGSGTGRAVALLALDAGERRGRERRLAALNRTTREMLRTKRVDDIAETAADAAVETLDPLGATVYVYDRGDGELRRAATSSGVAASRPSGGPVGRALPDDADEVAWDAFVAGEPRHLTGADDAARAGSRLVLPLGDSGVLVVAGATAGAFEEADVEFARTLATTVEVALDRAHRESTLLDRTDRLRERTETLDRLRRIDAVVRDIGQLLVRATDRRETEAAVCDRLAAVEGWEFAWIGRRSVAGSGIEPRSTSDDSGFVDAVISADPGGFGDAPVGDALASGTPRHVDDVVAYPGAGEWRELTLDYGFRSVVSIPLVHEGREYGVLEVYGDGSEAFGEAERSVLEELGEMIAYATAAIERERALVAGRGPEIELGTRDPDAFFARLARETGARVTVEGVVPRSEGGYLAYLTVGDRGDPAPAEPVPEVVERDPTVEGVRRVDDGDRYEVELSAAPLFERTAAHGGTVRAVIADGQECVVRVELPASVRVREFVAAMREEFPDMSVVARRPPREDSGDAEAAPMNRLTDRQREVLTVAYHSGFFEWPRASTGEEVADRIGVAPPTFHKHVRTAERKLLAALLDRPEPRG